jgi:hypothetical protein
MTDDAQSPATPGQAAYEALHASIARRQPDHIWVRWEAVNEINDGIPGEPLREDMEAAAQAAVKAQFDRMEKIAADAALAAQQPHSAPGRREATA